MEEFFKNASVAAFLGAAFSGISAVIVVAVNDWRRDRRMVGTIKAEIALAREHGKAKLETVRRKVATIREENPIRSGEVLRFDVAVVRELKGRVLHLIEPRQRQALDAVLHRMDGVDGLLDDVREREDDLRDTTRIDAYHGDQVAALKESLEDAITNLRVLDEIAERYVAGKFEAITSKQYRPEDYSDSPPASP